MTLRNAFENLATEDGQLTQEQYLEGILYTLAGILEKMPRVDSADRLVTSGSEVTQTVAISASQTLATLTTLGTITAIGGRDAAHASYALANAGAMHIYNNIVVS